VAAHDLARRLRIIPPVGNTKENEPFQPAPNPPTIGWWIDPEDARYARLYNGAWSDERILLRPEHLAVPQRPSAPDHWRKSYGLWLTSIWLRTLVGGFLISIATSLDRDATGYEWTNRIGLVLFFSVVVQATLFGFYSRFFMPERWDPHKVGGRFGSWLPFMVLAFGILFVVLLWDRLADALWLS